MILSKFLSVTKVDKDWLARAYIFLATKQANKPSTAIIDDGCSHHQRPSHASLLLDAGDIDHKIQYRTYHSTAATPKTRRLSNNVNAPLSFFRSKSI